MKTIFAILLMCFTGFAFADGHLAGEEGHHAETEADSGDHSAHEANAEEGDEGEGVWLRRTAAVSSRLRRC